MDTESFEQAVLTHQRMVFSIALYALRDRPLAEETTQDVFLALLQHGGEIQSPAHLAHWLRQVTSRKCVDQLRRRRWRRYLPLSERDEVAPAPPGGSFADPLLAERVQRLMRSLPARARLALVLRYEEDLDPAEIARVLGMPEKAVRQCLRQALRRMRLRLQAPPEPAPADAARAEESAPDQSHNHRHLRVRAEAARSRPELP